MSKDPFELKPMTLEQIKNFKQWSRKDYIKNMGKKNESNNR